MQEELIFPVPNHIATNTLTNNEQYLKICVVSDCGENCDYSMIFEVIGW